MTFQELIRNRFLQREPTDTVPEEERMNSVGFVTYFPADQHVIKFLDDDGGYVESVTAVRPKIYYNDALMDDDEADYFIIVIEGRDNAISRVLTYNQPLEVYRQIY